jgi:hypothetical protein
VARQTPQPDLDPTPPTMKTAASAPTTQKDKGKLTRPSTQVKATPEEVASSSDHNPTASGETVIPGTPQPTPNEPASRGASPSMPTFSNIKETANEIAEYMAAIKVAGTNIDHRNKLRKLAELLTKDIEAAEAEAKDSNRRIELALEEIADLIGQNTRLINENERITVENERLRRHINEARYSQNETTTNAQITNEGYALALDTTKALNERLDTLTDAFKAVTKRLMEQESRESKVQTIEQRLDAHIANSNGKMQQVLDVLQNSTKTWAQIVEQHPQPPRTSPPPRTHEAASVAPRMENSEDEARKKQLENIKREKAKLQTTLSLGGCPPEVREEIMINRAANVTAKLIEAVKKSVGEQWGRNVSLRGIERLSGGDIRIWSDKEEAAILLREKVNWNLAYEGLAVKNPMYGIVLHGVPTNIIDGHNIHQTDAPKLELENQSSNMKIIKIAPLKRKETLENGQIPPKHNSIVLFVNSEETARTCINDGVYIDHLRITAVRYAPQFRTTQCYNCQQYGHVADKCRASPKCGKCAGDHPTKECSESVLKCLICKGEHAAWDKKCEGRQKENERQAEIRRQASPYHAQ